jgi:hypothetical protein
VQKGSVDGWKFGYLANPLVVSLGINHKEKSCTLDSIIFASLTRFWRCGWCHNGVLILLFGVEARAQAIVTPMLKFLIALTN